MGEGRTIINESYRNAIFARPRGRMQSPRQDDTRSPQSPWRKVRERHPLSDESLIPGGTILVKQRAQAPGSIDSRRQARRIQAHQSCEGICRRGGTESMLQEDGRQTHGFAAKFAANGKLGVRSMVALVKQ
jgi:hypothetical protein